MGKKSFLVGLLLLSLISGCAVPIAQHQTDTSTINTIPIINAPNSTPKEITSPETKELPEKRSIPFCGNRICESIEDHLNCPSDCAMECKSEYCNDKVEVYCGCSEWENLSQWHNCIKNAGPCSDCSKQEKLFKEFLEMQTTVYDCLADYFQFKPLRVPYLIYYNSERTMPKCEQPKGCFGIEGGISFPRYILLHVLPGTQPYEENQPTKPEHLVADKHEMTHYFMFQMLGENIPSWFNEAVAIQTNERLYCHSQEDSLGDAYLDEREIKAGNKGGIVMSNGDVLNNDFYWKLKEGKVVLTSDERNSHILGTLFIIGLKEDYNCEKECFSRVVQNLYSLNKTNPELSSSQIRESINSVALTDTSPLFALLKINQGHTINESYIY